MLERQHGLDEAGDAGRVIEVADVRLDRPDGTEAPPVGSRPERVRQRRDLDRDRRAPCRFRAPRRRRIVPGDARAARCAAAMTSV